MLVEIILSTALVASVAWSVLAGRLHRRQVTELLREKVKVQTEERRVFDFLHGIGEALKDDTHSGDLHGLIVEGARRILEADGGALYLTNKKGTVLQPSYVSKGSPPFVVHALGVALLVARAAHAAGVYRSSGTSPGRFFGTALTWTMILGNAGVCVYYALAS